MTPIVAIHETIHAGQTTGALTWAYRLYRGVSEQPVHPLTCVYRWDPPETPHHTPSDLRVSGVSPLRGACARTGACAHAHGRARTYEDPAIAEKGMGINREIHEYVAGSLRFMELQAGQLREVRALHSVGDIPDACRECFKPWPCPTTKATTSDLRNELADPAHTRARRTRP